MTDFRYYVATDDEQPDMGGKRRDVIVAGPFLTAMQAEEARHWYMDRHPRTPAPYRLVVRPTPPTPATGHDHQEDA